MPRQSKRERKRSSNSHNSTRVCHLFNLPRDVFEYIFRGIVLELGVKRSLKARVVCKVFDVELLNALYSTKTINKAVPGSYRTPDLGVHPLRGIKFTSRLLQECVLDGSIKREPCFIVERIVDELISKGEDKTEATRLRYLSELCMMVAIRQGKRLVEALIPTLPEDLEKNWARISDESDIENHLLSAAAWIGDLELVRTLVDSRTRNGKAINTASHHMFTPLWAAATSGHMAIVSWLLEQGAKDIVLDEAIINYDTALCAAALSGHTKIVRLMLKQGSDINGEEIKNALRAAAIGGRVPIMGFLLDTIIEHLGRGEREKTPNQLYTGLKSALWLASQNGSAKIVEMLLDMGMDPDKTDDTSGRTCIHIAATNGHTETVKTLLRHGADYITSSFRQPSPITLAAAGGFVRTVKVLLDCWPNDYREKHWPSRALVDAAKNGHVEVVTLLLKRGFSIWKHRAGDYALCAACEEGYSSIVKLLARHGCHIHGDGKYFKPMYEDSPKGWSSLGFTPYAIPDRPSPMELATQCRRYNVVQTLIDLGVKYDPDIKPSSLYEDF